MKNILITGGAGFIGSYLAEELVKEGNIITVLDNFSRGKMGNLVGIENKITLVKDDILNNIILDKLTKNTDIVYHLAGISQVMESEQRPRLCFDCNVKGTYNVIDACIKSGAKLIFSSSREVYGDIEGESAHEDIPINPKSNYGISKMLGEAMIKSYGKSSGLDYMIFRIANVIGKKDFGRVVPIFIERCKKNEPIMLYGGKQVLDFVYISDVVDALKKAGDVKNEIVNLGSGKGTTVEELALKIKKLTGSNSEIVYAKERNEETQRFVANIDKARKLLDWEPKVKLDEALNKIIG